MTPELLRAIEQLDHGRLVVWTVYDHPTDYPDTFAARAYYATPTAEATALILVNDDLEALRLDLRSGGYVCVTRSPDDDPAIVETWL